MNEIEKYEFDRVGYLVIPGLLQPSEVQALSAASDALEDLAADLLERPVDKVSAWGPAYRHDATRGFYAQGAREPGKTMIIEDFFNVDDVFDMLVDHAPTMQYISAIVQERPHHQQFRAAHPLSGQPDGHAPGRSGCFKVSLFVYGARHQLHDGADDLLRT